MTLKQLSYLNVRNTSVNVDGLMALKSLPLVRIGYGGNVQELAEQASQIAALFPGIENLSLPRDSDPSVVQWAAIANAWPKLKRLEINSRKFADAACEGLPQLTALLEMDSPYSPITDAGVAKIATLKKLFWLNLTEAKITDAALESLADMKPLKTLKLPKPGNGLTSEGIAKLKKKRPDIEVR